MQSFQYQYDLALCNRFPNIAIEEPHNMCSVLVAKFQHCLAFKFRGPGWRLTTGKVHVFVA